MTGARSFTIKLDGFKDKRSSAIIASDARIAGHPSGPETAHTEFRLIEASLARLGEPHTALVQRQRTVERQLAFFEGRDDLVQFREVIFEWPLAGRLRSVSLATTFDLITSLIHDDSRFPSR